MVTGGPLPVRASISLTARSPKHHLRLEGGAGSAARGPGAARRSPGQPVDVQLLGRSGAWNTLHTLKTDFTGTATTNVRLTYNHALRARFAGIPGLGSAQSKPVSIGVRPLVSARAPSRPRRPSSGAAPRVAVAGHGQAGQALRAAARRPARPERASGGSAARS